MKKIIIISLLLGIGIATTLLWPKKALCVYCPQNICYSQGDCAGGCSCMADGYNQWGRCR